MSGAKKREGSSRGTAVAESSEVDEMIRAAEEELIIGLRVGSHTISSSLDADLARRFQALKSPRPSPHRKLANPSPQPSAPQTDQIRGDYTEEDLLERFAALKGAASRNQRSRTAPAANPFSIREDSVAEEKSKDGYGASKKKVEKVMRWAVDAARIDASRSKDDDEEHGKESDEEEEDDEELQSEDEEKKKKAMGKGRPGKWFSLFW